MKKGRCPTLQQQECAIIASIIFSSVSTNRKHLELSHVLNIYCRDELKWWTQIHLRSKMKLEIVISLTNSNHLLLIVNLAELIGNFICSIWYNIRYILHIRNIFRRHNAMMSKMSCLQVYSGFLQLSRVSLNTRR